MEELIFFLLEVIGELFINLAFESMVEVGGHKVKKARQLKKKKANTEKGLSDTSEEDSGGAVSALMIYVSLGLLLGVVSVIIFPHSFIKDPTARLVYLFLAPIAAGWTMTQFGNMRIRHGQEKIRLDNFFYGFLFALAMTGIRYGFAQ